MIQPAIEDLMKKADCKFSLVIETAKRARQLTEGASSLSGCKSKKPVSIAANEIHEDKITYVKTKSGIK
jgi:DNA-directed RNA polymerase subunit omega